MTTWVPTFATPYDYLYGVFHTEQKPDWNFSYYSNPAFDQLIEGVCEIRHRLAERRKDVQEANRMLIDDAPAIFIFDQPNRHVIRENLKGYVDNPAYAWVVFVYPLTR
ncbi:MAG: hypothetical protein U1F68_02120 [Gammaproteobacteria bacterium]